MSSFQFFFFFFCSFVGKKWKHQEEIQTRATEIKEAPSVVTFGLKNTTEKSPSTKT